MAKVVKVLFNHIPRIKAAVPGNLERTVRGAALQCETYAKDIVPVDTGALKNSIQAKPESPQVWEVAPHTEYAIYVEFGTYKMRAQPYMRPAAEKIRKAFPQLVTQAIVEAVKGEAEWFRTNTPDVTVHERAEE